jgi:hypothetical protein
MDICVRLLFCVCVVLCVDSVLATGWSPVRVVLPTAYRIRKTGEEAKAQQQACRACFCLYFSQIYSLLYNGAISKYVVRKHLCGAIIQWRFSYIYACCALCCACLYSSSSLWSFKSEGHCRFSMLLTFNGLLNSVT